MTDGPAPTADAEVEPIKDLLSPPVTGTGTDSDT